MAKSRPPRGGLKKAPEEKITPKSFIGALPCMVILLIGIGLMCLVFYAMLSSGLKTGAK
jgi:hypothetical protein